MLYEKGVGFAIVHDMYAFFYRGHRKRIVIMSKRNDDFFVEKKPWSKVKDELLGCYLKPYFTKILYTQKPVAYFDCFAGKGKFEDGKPGSPIIALDILQDVLASSKVGKISKVESTFIDLNYAADLKENLCNYSTTQIIAGSYKDSIEELLKSKKGYNVFLYIDPYGIKDLDFTKFENFANGQFNTIEILLNFNSFGFLREACNAMGTKFSIDDSGFFDDLVEFDSSNMGVADNAIDALNCIAGGLYWQNIIMRYKLGELDSYRAEELLSEEYCHRLNESYKYVLNMPIRIRSRQHPKYRLIYATNHPDGCVLMAENMCNRWELLNNIQNGGQYSLFPEDFNNSIIEYDRIDEYVVDHFSEYDNWISITEAQAHFYVKYGVICKPGEIANVLKKLARKERIQIERIPKLTSTGKQATFMTEGHGKTVLVKWVK